MTDEIPSLRRLRAERRRLEREVAQLEADKPPVVVTVRAMSTAEALKLLLEGPGGWLTGPVRRRSTVIGGECASSPPARATASGRGHCL